MQKQIHTVYNYLKSYTVHTGAILIVIMIGLILGLYHTINIEVAKSESLQEELNDNKEVIELTNQAIETKEKITIINTELEQLRKELDKTESLDECIESQLDRIVQGLEVDLEYCENKNELIDRDQQVIKEAMEFLRKHEGVRYKAYWDFNQYSICYGIRSTQGATATQEECDNMLRERVQSELLRINRLGDNLSVNKKVALISFFYNVGYKIEVLNYAARGDDDNVIYLISQYTHAGGIYNKGLDNRRKAEINIYKNGF